MGTVRVDVSLTAPTTEYYTEVDLISQDQAGNYSYVYTWVRAVNRGGTSSFSGYAGFQQSYVAGVGGTSHSGTQPSGVGANVTRWYDGPSGIVLYHDAAGYRGVDSVRQQIHGWHGSTGYDRNDYGSIGPYPRIPKRPSVPGTPVVSNLFPTSLKLDWTASTDDAGSAITGYLVRRWLGSTPTGPYVDVSETNTLTRNDTGLLPGTTYTYGVYAKNGSSDNGGYSNLSGTVTVKTIAPMRVRVAGIWKYAVPFLKVAGVWTITQPFVKVGDIWKATA